MFRSNASFVNCFLYLEKFYGTYDVTDELIIFSVLYINISLGG